MVKGNGAQKAWIVMDDLEAGLAHITQNLEDVTARVKKNLLKNGVKEAEIGRIIEELGKAYRANAQRKVVLLTSVREDVSLDKITGDDREVHQIRYSLDTTAGNVQASGRQETRINATGTRRRGTYEIAWSIDEYRNRSTPEEREFARELLGDKDSNGYLNGHDKGNSPHSN